MRIVMLVRVVRVVRVVMVAMVVMVVQGVGMVMVFLCGWGCLVGKAEYK